jgi:hypothetical protein
MSEPDRPIGDSPLRPDDSDPERARIGALLDAVRHGRATDAERTELALYEEEHPDLGARVHRTEQEQQLGEGWLERIDADDRLQAAENAPLVTAERFVGAGLAFGGYALAVVVPPVGAAMMVAGMGMLVWSFVRVRVKNLANDPYRRVKK